MIDIIFIYELKKVYFYSKKTYIYLSACIFVLIITNEISLKRYLLALTST